MITPSPAVDRRNILLVYGLLIFFLLVILSLYTLLHEGGHALMGLLFGGKITNFSANFLNLSAHVGIDGQFTRAQNALISVAGVSLPLLLVMLYLLASPKPEEPVLGWFQLILFMGTVNSLLAWIAIPVLVLLGQTPSDDSYNFLKTTGLHPLIVTGAALLIYLGCWVAYLRRSGGFRALIEPLRSAQLNLRQPVTQKNLRALAALGVLIVSITVALTSAMPDRTFEIPAGYQQVAEMSFSSGPLDDVVLYRFTLREPSSVSFFLRMRDVKGGPAKIRLTGPNGYGNTFFQDNAADLNIGQASVHPQDVVLEPGDYEIRVSFPRSAGQVTAAVKIE